MRPRSSGYVHGIVKRALLALVVVLSIVWAPAAARGTSDDPTRQGSLDGEAAAGSTERGTPASAPDHMTFFWGVGCPHCEQAKPFLETLAQEQPRVVIEWVEVRQDARGRERFLRTMESIGAEAAGVPTFVVGREYVVGFLPGASESEIGALLKRATSGESAPEAPREYLALYNMAYVVPLALIVGLYAATLHRMTLEERGAKILKAVSGALLVLFGLLFILAPEVLR